METESQAKYPFTRDTKLQCPVCRGATHVSRNQRAHHAKNIFSILFTKLFHQRVCSSCLCSFSNLKILDSLTLALMPVLVLIFPEINSFSECSMPGEMPAIIPDSAKKVSKNTPIKQSLEALPFSVKNANQEITIEMKCPLGEGEIKEQLRVAAQSLEISLHQAAKTISLLVTPAASIDANANDPLTKNTAEKKLVSKITSKSPKKKNRKSQQTH
jgi:hypothetical protein